MTLTYEEKERVYRTSANYNFGHRYLGYEGKRYSQMATNHKQRALDECAWVWDAYAKKWIKKPEAPR